MSTGLQQVRPRHTPLGTAQAGQLYARLDVRECALLTPVRRRLYRAPRSTVRAATTQVAAPRWTNRLTKRQSAAEAQESVLQSIRQVKGRGRSGITAEQQQAFDQAVSILTADGGVKAPTSSGMLDGRWKLLFTTRPGSASPIQRTFVGVNAFSVYQDISLEPDREPRVNNVVDFGAKIGQLVVEAEASTDSRPLPGFTPRQGKGLAVFGKSESYPAARKDLRIDFQFDRGTFNFSFLPFGIPYPVPFKALGDETKGWIDITYLSPDGTFRLSQGNKGTTFVLVRDRPLKEQLLAALDSRAPDAQIQRLADDLVAAGGGVQAPARSDALPGTWLGRWGAQGKDANRWQKAIAGRSRATQLIQEGELRNRFDLLPGVSIRAFAFCEPASQNRTAVTLQGFWLHVGPFKVPLPLTPKNPGYSDWLYLDETLRISRGSRGSVFIHTRVPS